jgi:aminopeptidase N
MQVTEAYAPDAGQSGKRALGAAVGALVRRLDGGASAAEQFKTADNMTLQLTALANLLRAGRGQEALSAFYQQWKGDRLVMDKWFGLQIGCSDPSETARLASGLTQHKDFDWQNPNRFRALFGSLAAHHAGFHAADGASYDLMADWLIRLDAKNPQTTARMCSAFQTWRRYDPDRQALMRAAMERILTRPGCSRDTHEMLTRILS